MKECLSYVLLSISVYTHGFHAVLHVSIFTLMDESPFTYRNCE